MEALAKFYAVTHSQESLSVYEVNARDADNPYPYAEKIHLQGESKVGIGERIDGDSMIAIARHIQSFTPEGCGLLTPMSTIERNLEKVNTHWWGKKSSPIVALFLTREEAMACAQESELQDCDPRWEDETKKVIGLIGNDHPTISVCRFRGLGLSLA